MKPAFFKWVSSWLLSVSVCAQAHKPSDSYLTLRSQGNLLTLQWDIRIKDIGMVIDLDNDADGSVIWGELRSHHQELESYAYSKLTFETAHGPCRTEEIQHLVDRRSDGAYTVMRGLLICPKTTDLIRVKYDLFFEVDAQHKGILTVESPPSSQTFLFSDKERTADILLSQPSKGRQLMQFLKSGVWHIWIGFDHILFLLTLLLPSVLFRHEGRWNSVDRFSDVFWRVFQVVTSFTVAHSLTLALASLNVILLPSRLVESTIALSVVLTSLNNLIPVLNQRHWIIAFAFGLIHGFGFASVLRESGLSEGNLILSLVGFNLGVECGQLALVCLVLPFLFQARKTLIYRRFILIGLSALSLVISICWMGERLFDLDFFPL